MTPPVTTTVPDDLSGPLSDVLSGAEAPLLSEDA